MRLAQHLFRNAHRPAVKIILGNNNNLGETFPTPGANGTEALSRGHADEEFSAGVFSTHFYVTTSGFFSDPALQCCIQEIGTSDRIMFSIDLGPMVQYGGVAVGCRDLD